MSVFGADKKFDGTTHPPGSLFAFSPNFHGPVKKRTLVAKIIAYLSAELEAYGKSARAAHAEATHEQNKAENKYDTRGLEASYLAHGQSRQAAQTEEARQQFETIIVRDFGPADPIDLSALVELEIKGEHSFYFIAPCAGGTEIRHGKNVVLVLTPQSPLGRQLIGKKKGDRLRIELGGVRNEYHVVAVS